MKMKQEYHSNVKTNIHYAFGNKQEQFFKKSRRVSKTHRD
jgi:hypothetical protein